MQSRGAAPRGEAGGAWPSAQNTGLSISNGHASEMDVRVPGPALRPYLRHIERLPFVRRVEELSAARDPKLGGRIRVTTPTGKVVLPVEVKRTHLTRAVGEHLIGLAGEHPGLLVMAPVVGRELAELFADHGINFVDLAGNCSVQIGEQYIARIQGKRAERRPPTEKVLRAPAYRVLFALLADPELVGATGRALAEAAGGVSPQTAVDVRKRLLARGVLLEARGGLRWAPGRRSEALDLLLAGFPALTPGLVIGRYRAKQRTPEALEAELAPRLARVGEWRWGGGAAAMRLTGLYRGDRTIVYLRELDPAKVRALPLVPDAEGEVVLLRAPGPLAFNGPELGVAHPLLVYLDLLTEGHERAREAAAEIYRRYLDETRA